MSSWSDSDHEYMRAALDSAADAAESGEVPVGAVLVMHRKIIARAGNQTVRDCDPSGHAEIVALRTAASLIGNHRMPDASLYVTLEPCTMCVGAIVQARIGRVVFGAYDARLGALGSALDLSVSGGFNHQFEVNGGLLQGDCLALLQDFFAARRPPSTDANG